MNEITLRKAKRLVYAGEYSRDPDESHAIAKRIVREGFPSLIVKNGMVDADELALVIRYIKDGRNGKR